MAKVKQTVEQVGADRAIRFPENWAARERAGVFSVVAYHQGKEIGRYMTPSTARHAAAGFVDGVSTYPWGQTLVPGEDSAGRALPPL